MKQVNQILAALLILMSILVGVHWIASPLYDNSSGAYPVWVILNFPMAALIIVCLITNTLRKRRLSTEASDGAVTRNYLETNVKFYASLVLTLWFFWNWFYAFFPSNEPEAVGQIHLMMWAFINPVLTVPVFFATGAYLWRRSKGAEF